MVGSNSVVGSSVVVVVVDVVMTVVVVGFGVVVVGFGVVVASGVGSGVVGSGDRKSVV